MYAYVHWVLIQAVPFAFFISILRLRALNIVMLANNWVRGTRPTTHLRFVN